MNHDHLQKREERLSRNRWFFRGFGLFFFVLTAFLIWKLNGILLPILIGAILAYLFRPVKNWFQIRWLPNEARVILAFALTGLVISGVFFRARGLVPDERQKLELKVRLKYKLNERYQDVFAKPNPVERVFQKEITPMFNQLNEWLTLAPDEIALFNRYHQGFHGEPPISERYYDYFKQSLRQSNASADVTADISDAGPAQGHVLEALSIWILTPLVFLFLIFDNGQIRMNLISIVPNRYFEMALTMVDDLDEAIGNYLRGTFLECALVGMTLGIGLFLLGFPISVALFVAIVSGMANAIPFLGPLIGLVISIAYALIAEDTIPLLPGLTAAHLPLYVAILVAITHALDNVLYSPIVLGKAVNLHPLIVIIAIAAGSILLGFWGMLLAIPTVVILKTATETLIKELKAYRII